MKENLWTKQRYCSISCSKIHDNCMRSPVVRAKVSRTLKSKGYAPVIRGGNGTLTDPQMKLLNRLGGGWVPEVVVPVPNYRTHSLPKNLKIDIANRQLHIAIELDGASHRSPSRRAKDSRKTLFLARRGWCVLRITNERANELSSIFMSPDTLLTSLMAFWSTTAT